MHFTGTTRPLLLLEFQGFLDYLKVVENKLSFWEIKLLEVNHKVGPCNFSNRITELKTSASLDIYLPGKITGVFIYLSYSSEQKKETQGRWEAIIQDMENWDND
jgi:hypothetical protein